MRIIALIIAILCSLDLAVSAQMETPQLDTSQPAAGAAPQQVQSPPLVLHGGLEHSERLAPVEPQLQAGAVFSDQSIPKLQPNNDWYWIPAWYAGQKHVDSETILQDHSFKTGRTVTQNRVVMNRQDLSIGFQADRNGQIWEFKRAPYTTTVEGNDYFTTMLVRSRDPVSVNQNVVVIRMVQTSVNVDKRSRRILKTMQEEQINTYYPSAQGVMKMQTSIRSFGADGAPQIEETSTRVVYTSAAFAPVDYYEGRDLRVLFRDYLLSHGFASYVPDYLKEGAEQNASAGPAYQPNPAASPYPSYQPR